MSHVKVDVTVSRLAGEEPLDFKEIETFLREKLEKPLKKAKLHAYIYAVDPARESDTITYQSYWKEIGEQVDEAIKDAMGDDERDKDTIREACDTWLHESIDGHQWIIYNHYHADVLKFSDHEDAAEEIGGLDGTLKEKGVSGLMAVLAFCAMKEDCMVRLDDAIDAAIEAAEEADAAKEAAEEDDKPVHGAAYCESCGSPAGTSHGKDCESRAFEAGKAAHRETEEP